MNNREGLKRENVHAPLQHVWHQLVWVDMDSNNEIPHALPPFEVMEALIKMRANADTLIEHGGSQENWAMYEDSLMRHCHLFLKRTKAWHKTRQW